MLRYSDAFGSTHIGKKGNMGTIGRPIRLAMEKPKSETSHKYRRLVDAIILLLRQIIHAEFRTEATMVYRRCQRKI